MKHPVATAVALFTLVAVGAPHADRAAGATCPQACADAISQAAGFPHSPTVSYDQVCFWDAPLEAGTVDLAAPLPGYILLTGAQTCIVERQAVRLADMALTSDEQAACALLAAPVSASLSGAPCDLSIPNGFACAASDQCVSGNCTDGVCCETACDQPLQQCNLPGQLGTCASTAATAAAAPALTLHGLLAAAAVLGGIAALALRRSAWRS